MNVWKYINKFNPKEGDAQEVLPQEDLTHILDEVESRVSELDELKEAQELEAIMADEQRAKETLTKVREAIKRALGTEPSDELVNNLLNKI